MCGTRHQSRANSAFVTSTTATKTQAQAQAQAQAHTALERNILVQLGVERSFDILEREHDQGQIDYDAIPSCCTSKKAPNRNGYVDVKKYTSQQLEDARAQGKAVEKKAGKHYYLHRVAFCAATGRNPVHEVSHWCANEKCSRPAHMVDEGHTTNLERTRWPGPGFLDDHGHLIPLANSSKTRCFHHPPCHPLRTHVLACPHSNDEAQYVHPLNRQQTLPEYKFEREESSGDIGKALG